MNEASLNNTKPLPCSHAQLQAIAREYPTPFYLYDERAIRGNARDLRAAFSAWPGFQEFFAVKATPNPAILRVLNQEGFGADCSSMAELVLAERSGITGEMIMFTSNTTPAQEFQKARELGAIINLDDLGHLPFLQEHAGLPEILSFRYNPGGLSSGNHIIGEPLQSKFGVTREQLFEGYQQARQQGVQRFGLHTMVASNELDRATLVHSARMLFELVFELQNTLGISIEFVNIGGGIGIPYWPTEQAVDYHALAGDIVVAYAETLGSQGLARPRLFMECGRVITGPYGYLVTTVRHLKQTYRQYAGLDATMANLMRPGMYGAYHHISVPGKATLPYNRIYDVTGSLCENNDKFATERALPELAVGDIVVIHDAGAHGHAMGFNYNGKLRSAELLLREDGSVQCIRRAETLDDYFATLE